MKKKLVLILVLVLCAALLFTFAACRPDSENPDDTTIVDPNDETPTDPNGETPTDPAVITEAEATTTIAVIGEKAELWLLNNGVDTYSNRSNELKTAITSYAKIGEVNPTSVAVIYNDTTHAYTITVKWGSREASCTVAERLNNWGASGRIGKEYLANNDGEDVEDVIVEVYNAFIRTINDAKAKGEAFPNDSIGFNAKAYLVAGYGEGGGVDVALQVKGNIGDTDAKTDLAIELLVDDEVAYGLYFDGGAAKEECRIYLRAGDNYIHINQANVVSMITNLVGYEPTAAAEESGEPVEESGELKEIEELAELFGPEGEETADMLLFVMGILFQNGGVIVEDGDTTTYQIMLDFDELISSISTLVTSLGLGDTINGIISELLPPPLDQLDLGSVGGITGELLITVITTDGLVSDAEISLNMPERDFRFSATDNVSKMYGPLNFAFGLEGVNLAEQTDIIPVIEASEYFSPLNINFTGDVTVRAEDKGEDGEVLVDSVFSFDIKTEINPFNLGVAKGYIYITELKNGETVATDFLYVSYDQSTGDGYLAFKDEFAYMVNAIDIYEYIVDNYTIDAEEFVTKLISRFMSMTAKADDPDDDEDENGFDIMALIGAVGDIQAWYDALVENNKVLLSIDKEALLDSEIAVSIVTDDINDILAVINSIGLFPEDIPALTNPESVEVYFNGEDYENVFYVKVVVNEIGEDDEVTEVIYIFEIDGTMWADDKIINVTFSIDDVEMARLNIAYVESDEPDVLIVDADKVYTVILTLELIQDPDADTIEYDIYVFEGCVTENEDGVLNGLQATFTYCDDSFYTVYGEGVGIWTYSGLEGIKDLNFTFENIPHYGFGYDSDGFKLDVDIDNLYFNWGAENKDKPFPNQSGKIYVDKADDVKEFIEWLMEDLGIEPIELPE